MKRELQVYALGFLVMFFLGAAAPIGLNPGGSGFDGGSMTVVSGGADGTVAAPTYSFSGDTDLGVYRGSANITTLALGNSEKLELASGISSSTVRAAASTDLSTTASAPFIRSTDADTGLTYNAEVGINYVVNGTGIANFQYDATSGAKFCLDQYGDNDAPCLMTNGTTSTLGITDGNSTGYTGYLDLGSGNIKAYGGTASTPAISFDDSTATGFHSGPSTTAFYIVSASAIVGTLGVTSGVDGLYQYSSSAYMRISEIAGDAPTQAAADCTSDSHRGRMVLDNVNDRLYVCDGVTNGWMYYALSDT